MIDTFIAGYFCVGLISGLIAAVIGIVLAEMEGERDLQGVVIVLSFVFLFWPVLIPFLIWMVWRDHL